MRLTHAGIPTKLVVATILTSLAIMLLTVVGEIRITQAKRDEIQIEVDIMVEENQRMSHALEFKDDPEMLEQVARAKGYIKQGETPFVNVGG